MEWDKEKILLTIYYTLIIIGLIFWSCSCSVNKKTKPCKQCPQYSIMPVCDTINFELPHYNYNNICYPPKIITMVEHDTIYIDNFQWNLEN